MSENHDAKIEYVDVVIVGGGIAGVAIAEFLSRHSHLSIRVLESAPQLGTQASGKLEGWFHTGALYAGQDDAQTFINCVNSLEDLINFYSPYFPERCNFSLQSTNSSIFRPATIPQSQGWFSADSVYLIHPQADAPEIRHSRLKSDAVQLEIQRNRVLGRLEVAYGQEYNWQQAGQCLAPTYAQVEDYDGINCSLHQANASIVQLCQRFDRSFGLEPSYYDILGTVDCSMNTSTILQDLVASALHHEVTFETGIAMDQLLIDQYGSIRIKSLLYQDSKGDRKRLKANLFIFTVGSGFAPFLKDLQIRARLKRSRSAMVVAEPALIETNFVRMSTKQRFHFNHFFQRRQMSERSLQYSLLADSGYVNHEADDAVDIEPILEAAERYFGKDKLYHRQLFSYECVKTEFISEEEQKRRYSYWIESNANSNYLCVLPGKFSFFPTVAYQTYQKIKDIFPFDQSMPKGTFNAPHHIQEMAKKLVAESYPVSLLQK